MDRQSHPAPDNDTGRTNEQNVRLALDYLRSRTAGGTVRDSRPALPDRRESGDSAERKRRHTGSEPQRRDYPYPTYNATASHLHHAARLPSPPGSSRETAIDLTSPPAQPQPRPARPSIPRMPGSDDGRRSPGGAAPSATRDSDIVLPRWQPDNDVTKCPVCDTEFSLLYRRHHCRKCGRVPPNPYLLGDEAAPSTSPSSRRNPALGGGDIVRVCNPLLMLPFKVLVLPFNDRGRTLITPWTLRNHHKHLFRPLPQVMSPSLPDQSRPRRQVREEDECPVCGEEMPPGDSVRETHIEDCIATRFSSTPTQSAVRPPPAPGTPESVGHAPEGSRPRATSFRPRGMLKSKATEKDCVGADGEPQECIICFEEFEEGDDLGTMECWCKFHRDCIRGWWEKKGPGSCPTHRLYD
ncbi:uncharacterized protein MYCFIDRAFT_215336 [Pseudocercospora fijiensis CIRAD86]|uniref:RING-type E3 ubiquitin transferase n=1 Tax=Pseudocercospora fijiensis (strain CIRAD86) TaxID=383855 RepID=M3B269_PSEFD|nr:uncharacterized protein MYCFIDRAFT_215336 [Pseudocercospora fijiensis CIRAD86]EME83507.1 hypothetical protein MYCFIDRAFT_215336 [Pseudocercospora fijiensis CIRAD86]